MHSLSDYDVWLFDCDGVLLNSNRIKTNAFKAISEVYGDDAITAFINYHISNGGVSRYEKIAYFCHEILGVANPKELTQILLDQFADYVFAELLTCDEAPCLREFLQVLNQNHTCFVVSGGDEKELNRVFSSRGLSKLFETVIGSPRNKLEILESLRNMGKLGNNPIFIGDAEYDFKAADHFGIDFIFLSAMSEFKGWERFFENKDVLIFDGLCAVAEKYNE